MSTSILFSIVDREVVVTDLESGRTIWSGRPLGRAVVDLVQLEDSARAVVLLESFGTAPDDRSNLVAIDSWGEVLWRATLPTMNSTDCFTSVESADCEIAAFSWSAHRLRIDPGTGQTLGDEFTK